MDYTGDADIYEAQRLRPHIKVTESCGPASVCIICNVLTPACPGHKSNSAVESEQLRHNVHCSAPALTLLSCRNADCEFRSSVVAERRGLTARQLRRMRSR